MDAQHQPPTRVIAPPPAIADDVAPITAGRYLQLRRQAVNFSIEQAIGHTGLIGDLPALKRWAAAEANETPLHREVIELVSKAFPFDPFVYECLRDEIPAGRICVGCGCTWNDACISAVGAACMWTDLVPTRCSSCVARLVDGGTVGAIATPVDATQTLIAALRPFAAAARKIASACPDGREMEFRFSARQYRAAALALIHAGVR